MNQALNNINNATSSNAPKAASSAITTKKEENNMTTNNAINTESTMSNRQIKAIAKKYNTIAKDKETLSPENMHLIVTKKARNLFNGTDLMSAWNTFADTITVYDTIKPLKAPEELMNPISKEVRAKEDKALTKAINDYRFDDATSLTIQRIAEAHFNPTSKENLTLVKKLLEQLGLEAQGTEQMAEVAFYINSLVGTKETTNLQMVRKDASSRLDFKGFYHQIVRMMVLLVNRDNERAANKTRIERIKEENGTLKAFLEAKAEEEKAKEAKKAEKEAKRKEKETEKANKKNNKTTKKATKKTTQSTQTTKAAQ